MQVFCQESSRRPLGLTSSHRRRKPLVKNPPLAALRANWGARVSKSYRADHANRPSERGVLFSLLLPSLGLLIGNSALAAGPAGPAAPPPQIAEPLSGQSFSSPLEYTKKPYILVGTGLRKDATVKYYAMALYVDEAAKPSFNGVYDRAGRRKAGLFFESRAQNYYIWGHFAKLGVLRFLKPMPKDELQKSFRDGLAELLTPTAVPEVRKDALTFIELLDADLKEGQELRLHCDDVGHLDVQLDAVKKSGPQNAKLCRHIWDIWLGFHPVQKEMRNTLLDRLEVLAR